MTKQGRKIFSKFDVNRDGTLTPEELQEAKELLALELQEEKADTQRRIAWTTMAAMIGYTVVVLSPLLSDERVKALGGISDLFYVGCMSIIGAAMGFTAWMQNSRSESVYGSYSSTYEEVGRYGKTD